MFDADPGAFGSVDVRERLPDGRHGPVFLGRGAETGDPVVIRTFDTPLDQAQQNLLLEALHQVCDAPLQHVSIARPIACGLAAGRVYVVHTYLPGLPADAWLNAGGPRPLAQLLLPMASAAAAIDFAAAAGVHHGALSAADVIIDGDTAGITGWGIEQARAAAGLADAPVHADDVVALASVVSGLVTAADARLVRDAFERAHPATALEFVSALQETLATPAPPDVLPADVIPADVTSAGFSRDAIDDRFDFDAPLHVDDTPEAPAFVDTPAFDDTPAFADEPQPFAVVEADEARPMFGVREQARSTRTRWYAVAGVAVITLAVGFAGGLLVGRGDVVPSPTVTPPPLVAATAGRMFTDAPVVASEAPPSAVVAAPVPAPATVPSPALPRASTPQATPRNEARRDVQRSTDSEAMLQVDSRPQGAQVYVDGRLIGRTPVIAGGLRPGQHAVRMQLAGHRPWATQLIVAPGERARVGGSLEEQ